MVIRRDNLHSDDDAGDGGFSKDPTLVHNDIRPCVCGGLRSCTINKKETDTTFLDLDSTLLHKLHEMGEDDITGPPGVNDIRQYLVPREEIGQLVSHAIIVPQWLGQLINTLIYQHI
jgi:hypothetical protein